jgi:hypothetical protein
MVVLGIDGCCYVDVARKSLAASIWIPSAAGNVSIGDVTGLRLAVSTDMMNEMLWLWAVFAQQGLDIGKATSQVSLSGSSPSLSSLLRHFPWL